MKRVRPAAALALVAGAGAFLDLEVRPHVDASADLTVWCAQIGEIDVLVDAEMFRVLAGKA